MSGVGKVRPTVFSNVSTFGEGVYNAVMGLLCMICFITSIVVCGLISPFVWTLLFLAYGGRLVRATEALRKYLEWTVVIPSELAYLIVRALVYGLDSEEGDE